VRALALGHTNVWVRQHIVAVVSPAEDAGKGDDDNNWVGASVAEPDFLEGLGLHSCIAATPGHHRGAAGMRAIP